MPLPNDIAIIPVPEAFDFSGPYVKKACLPPAEDTDYVGNTECYITGWGQTIGIKIKQIILHNIVFHFLLKSYNVQLCTLPFKCFHNLDLKVSHSLLDFYS